MRVFWSNQEKEYKEAMEAFNEKSKEKAQLMATLMQVSSIRILHNRLRIVSSPHLIIVLL